MEVKKQKLEMAKIEQKYGNQLLQEVQKDMGLPCMPVPNIVPSPSTSENPKHQTPPGPFTPTGLFMKVKSKKYNITELGEPECSYPSMTSPHGQKQPNTGECTPPAKKICKQR